MGDWRGGVDSTHRRRWKDVDNSTDIYGSKSARHLFAQESELGGRFKWDNLAAWLDSAHVCPDLFQPISEIAVPLLRDENTQWVINN